MITTGSSRGRRGVSRCRVPASGGGPDYASWPCVLAVAGVWSCTPRPRRDRARRRNAARTRAGTRRRPRGARRTPRRASRGRAAPPSSAAAGCRCLGPRAPRPRGPARPRRRPDRARSVAQPRPPASRTSSSDTRCSSTGRSSASTNRLTPTMTRSPDSIPCWIAERRVVDLVLVEARLDRRDGAAHRLDPLDVVQRQPLELVGERLDVVRAAERIGDVSPRRSRSRSPAASAARSSTARSVGSAERLVERVRVQRLRAAEHRGHRLERGPDDVVLGLLRGERRARRSACGTGASRSSGPSRRTARA